MIFSCKHIMCSLLYHPPHLPIAIPHPFLLPNPSQIVPLLFTSCDSLCHASALPVRVPTGNSHLFRRGKWAGFGPLRGSVS